MRSDGFRILHFLCAGAAHAEPDGFHGDPIWPAMWLIMVVQLSDVVQYVCGELFGRRKVAPVLSPSKTVEGLVGGVVLATGFGVLTSWMTPFNDWQAGFFGGLAMFAINRDRGVKDWGQLIQGHGGMLDRIDSIRLSAPVFFHMLRF